MDINHDELLKKECGKYFWERKYVWVLYRDREIITSHDWVCCSHELYAKRMMKYLYKLLYS